MDDIMTVTEPLKLDFFDKKAPRLAHAMYAAAVVCNMKVGDGLCTGRCAAVIKEHGFMKMSPKKMKAYLDVAPLQEEL